MNVARDIQELTFAQVGDDPSGDEFHVDDAYVGIA